MSLSRHTSSGLSLTYPAFCRPWDARSRDAACASVPTTGGPILPQRPHSSMGPPPFTRRSAALAGLLPNPPSSHPAGTSTSSQDPSLPLRPPSARAAAAAGASEAVCQSSSARVQGGTQRSRGRQPRQLSAWWGHGQNVVVLHDALDIPVKCLCACDCFNRPCFVLVSNDGIGARFVLPLSVSTGARPGSAHGQHLTKSLAPNFAEPLQLTRLSGHLRKSTIRSFPLRSVQCLVLLARAREAEEDANLALQMDRLGAMDAWSLPTPSSAETGEGWTSWRVPVGPHSTSGRSRPVPLMCCVVQLSFWAVANFALLLAILLFALFPWYASMHSCRLDRDGGCFAS